MIGFYFDIGYRRSALQGKVFYITIARYIYSRMSYVYKKIHYFIFKFIFAGYSICGSPSFQASNSTVNISSSYVIAIVRLFHSPPAQP